MVQTHRILPDVKYKPFDVYHFVYTKVQGSFFFESAPEIGAPTEISVIGLGPFEILRDRGGVVERVRGGQPDEQLDGQSDDDSTDQVEILDEPFLSELGKRVSEIQVAAPAAAGFCGGGAFGIVGYDTVSEIETRLKKTKYFHTSVGDIRAEVAIARKLIIFEHKKKLIHLIDLDGGEGLSQMENYVRSAPMRRSTVDSDLTELDHKRLDGSLGEGGYRKGFEQIMSHIKSGDIFQAVLAEQFNCELQADPIEVFEVLRLTSPTPYCFYFKLADKVYFGASPESLVKVEGQRLRSHPIAGTRPRGKNRKEDLAQARSLLRSQKEASEHMMLVDLARNDLGRVAAAGSVHVQAFRKLKRFSNVMHLVSDIGARLESGMKAIDALRATFPAGTLSGAPKVRAMEILADLEKAPRGFYGGAVVAFDSHGGLDSCIAIRSAGVTGRTATLSAGAGIVNDSKFEKEYQEVHHKLRALRIAIGTAESNRKHKRESS